MDLEGVRKPENLDITHVDIANLLSNSSLGIETDMLKLWGDKATLSHFLVNTI